MKIIFRHLDIKLISMILVAVTMLGQSALADGKTRQYYLYGDPMPGTKFKRKILTGPLPYDRSYHQFSDSQKAIVRDSYSGLLATETPPYPKNGTKVIYKPIIKALTKVRREGDLLAIAMVNQAGKVENVTVYQSPADEFTELVNSLLFATEFDPATCNGEPCKMEYLFKMALKVVPN